MPRRHHYLLSLLLISPCIFLRAYSQSSVQPPGCSVPYFKGNYGPEHDGVVALLSSAVGPDGCIYLGAMNYPTFSIIKLDSFGNMIRSTGYTPSGILDFQAAGKTIVDQDGNLFSVMFNNYLLRTDTVGNILSGSEFTFIGGGTYFNFQDLSMLPNGDKVFLFAATVGGSQAEFVVVTSPDASVIRWTKYLYAYTSSNSYAALATFGNRIVVAAGFAGSYYFPNGSGIFELDASTGTLLHQRWFSQVLTFQQTSGYNSGYIFSGTTITPGYTSFYLRTDSALNVIAANNFPSSSIGWPNGTPIVFQAQPDGSVYGFYASSSLMALFLISPGDVIEWASGLQGFYQQPLTLTLSPSGIFIGTQWSATDVVTGYEISDMQLYKSSYSGYFPPCTYPSPATMSMAHYQLDQINPLMPFSDTTAFTTSPSPVQQAAGYTLVAQTCSGTPSCNSLHLTGNPNVCTGTGAFTGNTNAGCALPLTWSVTGPDTSSIQTSNSNSATIRFNHDGTYTVKALFNANCTILADSLMVHVSTDARLSLGNDTLLCAGDTLRLTASSDFSSYTWQDGSTDSTFLVKTQGQYSITALDYCGNTSSSTVRVSFRPPLTSPFPAGITKCMSDTLSLPLPAGFDTVYFVSPAPDTRIQNGDVKFFNPVAGSYALRETDTHGCLVNSNIAIQVYPQPLLHIGNDTTVCPGDSIQLDAGIGFSQYQWNTGSVGQAIWVQKKSAYWVQVVTTNGCVLRDTVSLTAYPAPVVQLDPDTVLCTGSTRQLFAGAGFTSYRWSDGSTSSSLTIDSTGEYWVSVTDGQGCSAADTVDIRTIAPLPANFLPADTTICQYGSLTLTPYGKFSSYQWTGGSTSSSITVRSPGWYSLQVMDNNGCIGTDSVLLTGKQCLIGFYIPNAFTPNGDGKNDIFRPLIYGNLVNYTFTIFNRWGQMVYRSNEQGSGWDGAIHGIPEPAGTYVWNCTYQLQGEPVTTQHGTVLLIR